jgi:hypothetical protein
MKAVLATGNFFQVFISGLVHLSMLCVVSLLQVIIVVVRLASLYVKLARKAAYFSIIQLSNFSQVFV